LISARRRTAVTAVLLSANLAGDIYVRPAAASDMPGVLAIYNHAVAHTTASYDTQPRSLEQQVEILAERQRGGHPFFVAVDGAGQVLGYSTYGPYRPRPGWRFACEHSVYVAASAHRRGIGALLMPPLLAHARRRGLHSMVGVVDAANAASIAFHQAFGFETFGVMKEGGHKFDRWLDVAFMQRLL
jgi:L-amino acid N-acyltransferase YncA